MAKFGIRVEDFGDEYFHLGDDETLWEWIHAGLPEGYTLADTLISVEAPNGYVFRGGALVKVGATVSQWLEKEAPATSYNVTIGSFLDDKAHLVRAGLPDVEEEEFENAGLSEERIFETVAY